MANVRPTVRPPQAGETPTSCLSPRRPPPSSFSPPSAARSKGPAPTSPSSPSFAAEARSSFVHYVDSPPAAPRAPARHLSLLSRKSSKSRTDSRPLSSHKFTDRLSSGGATPDSPSSPTKSASWKQKRLVARVGWALEQTFNPGSLQQISAENDTPKRTTVSRPQSSATRRDSVLSTTDSSAPSQDPSILTVSQDGYYDTKPFARRSSCYSRPQSAVELTSSDKEDIFQQTIELPPVREDTDATPPPDSPEPDFADFSRQVFKEFAAIEKDSVDDMGLTRAFTKRLGRPTTPTEEMSKRPQISLPMGLISTTNQWVHNAPNIRKTPESPSSATESSDANTSPSTPPLMTDTSSVESYSPEEPSHLSTVHFPGAESPSKDSKAPVQETFLIDAPALPRRAPSHSKREHERLAHRRSVRGRRGAGETSTATESVDVKDYTPDSVASPFSSELAQLNEVAEEFGYAARAAEYEEDKRVMRKYGLVKWSANDYLADISSLAVGLWDDDNTAPLWI